MTPEYIKGMSENEFSKWRSFIADKGFAFERLEFLLSQIAYLLGLRLGIKDCKFQDFTVDGQVKTGKGDNEKINSKKAKRRTFAGLDGRIRRGNDKGKH